MKVREILKLVRDDGWQLVRQRGSHRQFQHPEKPGTVTVAGNPGVDLHPKTARSILRQARLGTVE
ncbi:MAG TPA: type II toxin-antitoxin system HicA family toxin [Gemmataceae bacterium]|nr:type II toxin-antitoxin system HicA family toxin [Gemmataceae bacterium]